LRALREQAGNLPYWKMARRSRGGASKSALAQATAGKQIPSERVLDAFVGVCGGDLNYWRARRQHALSELAAAAQAAAQPGTQLVPLTRQTPAPQHSEEPPGVQDDDARPGPDRQPGEVVRSAAGTSPVKNAGSVAAPSAADDIIDAEVVDDSLFRRVLAAAGGRRPLYLAAVAVLVAGTALITATLRDSAFSTAAGGEHDAVPSPTPPLKGAGGPGTSTPAPTGTPTTPILPPVVAPPPAVSGAPTPRLDSGRTHQPRDNGTAPVLKPGKTATVYRVTGADSRGLAIQSQPHINHVIRYVPNGTPLHVACQTNHGDWVAEDDRWQYGRHFTTWDQLTDGTWVYDWYTDTPRVDQSGYSPGISPCPGG
jgi:hypothetical protein